MQRTSCPCARKHSHRWEPMKPAPPVIKYLAMFPSYRKILEAELSQVQGIVNISSVETHSTRSRSTEPLRHTEHRSCAERRGFAPRKSFALPASPPDRKPEPWP